MNPRPRHLLVFCFAVDDEHPTLNFAIGWYRSLLSHYDAIDIIAFDVGHHDLPPAIRVHQLKRPGDWRLARLWRFWQLAARLCRERRPLVVFSHMNTALTVAFWPLAFLLRLRQVLWYAHAQITPLLRCAVTCCDRVVTSTPEGCRVPTGKLRCIGQGVDGRVYSARGCDDERSDAVTTGRIAGSKNLDLLIAAFVRAGHPSARLHIIGSPARREDEDLERRLRQLWSSEPRVVFHGFKRPPEIAGIYRSCAVFINLSDTGSLDKANLEAAMSGLAVVTSNRAFAAFVRSHGLPEDLLLGSPQDDAAPLIRRALDAPGPLLARHAGIGRIVAAEHDLDGLISRLAGELSSHERAP